MAALVVAGMAAAGCHKADDEKVGSDVKTAAQDTATAAKDAYSDGKEKAIELATNTSAIVKEGVQKAGSVAANIAAAVKSATTNVVQKVDAMVH